MAIPYVTDTLDSIPEAFRGEYAEKDGKYTLAVDGIPDTPPNLKSALEKERAARKTLEKTAADWQKLGKSPEEIAAVLASAGESAAKSASFDAVLKQHKESFAIEKAALLADRDAAHKSEHDALKNATLHAALSAAKATREGLDLLTERLGERIKIETVGGKRVVTITDDDGKPMSGKGPDGRATIVDLVNGAISRFPSMFAASGGGGGGKPSRNHARPSPTISRRDYEALPVHERSAKIRDGIQIVD